VTEPKDQSPAETRVDQTRIDRQDIQPTINLGPGQLISGAGSAEPSEDAAATMELSGDRSGAADPDAVATVSIQGGVSTGGAGESAVTKGPSATRGAMGGISFDVGDRIGRYRIEGELGRGAMGLVLRARDEELDRMVALKVLPPMIGMNPEAVGRFQREAKAVARLEHKNIIKIHDFGADQGIHFYAMEIVEGTDMAELIRRERPGYAEVCKLIAKIARALDFAHGMGVIHRDIKPANILIDGAGEPRLTDFGLARIDGRSSLTAEGTILGTPLYMSPEQANGESRLTRHSDIYSLGATLYEAATGKPPYEGKTAQEIILKVMSERPQSPKLVDGRLPTDLAAIISRAMAREPGERYFTAREFAQDLENFTSARPLRLKARQSSFKDEERPATRAFVIFGVLTVIAGIIGFVSFHSRRADRAQRAADKAKLELAELKKTVSKPLVETGALDALMDEEIIVTQADRDAALGFRAERDKLAKKAFAGLAKTQVSPALVKEAAKKLKAANLRVKEGDFFGADALLAEVLQMNPRNASALLLRAYTLHNKGEYPRAIELFSIALLIPKLERNLAMKIHLRRGRSYVELTNGPCDVLAEEDFGLAGGRYKLLSQLETAKLELKRNRLAESYVAYGTFIDRYRVGHPARRAEITRLMLAESYYHYALLGLRLGRSLKRARGAVEVARDYLGEGQDELRMEIEELLGAILDAQAERGDPPESKDAPSEFEKVKPVRGFGD